jgi:Pyruvate/2-oxoacid:ferredoxin oxidoreductase gamma subunit
VEREIMFTGIGGQSVQLAAQILARASLREGLHAMVLGTYGGTMRGGNTDSTVIVGDAPIVSPPIVSSTWAALVMHHQFWQPLREKLRPDSIVVVNSSLFEGLQEELDPGVENAEGSISKPSVFEVPATKMASDLGNALGASMVLLGAFVSLTRLTGLDALIEAMRESIPSYRQQHVAANETALKVGFEAFPPGRVGAWNDESDAR